jgi:hypothetical protein
VNAPAILLAMNNNTHRNPSDNADLLLQTIDDVCFQTMKATTTATRTGRT